MTQTRLEPVAPSRPLLDIIVIHHQDSEYGQQVFTRLINHYHSPAFAGLTGGSVEVYHRSTPWSLADPSSAPRPVPTSSSNPPAAQFTIVIPVIDTLLIRATTTDYASWSLYLKDTLTTEIHGESRRLVIPVIIDQAFPMHGPLADLVNRTQGIRVSTNQLAAHEDSSTANKETPWIDHLFLEREVSQAIVQHISPDWNSEHPLKVFISHTKKKNTSGEMDVTDVVKEIIADTHLHSFFDENSIQTSDEWRKELRRNASRCALLMIRTDLYASRLWTQEEVLFAKENDVPIVSLSALAIGEERGSFLMDHVPTVAFSPREPHSSVARALCRLVDEALKRTLWMFQTSFTSDHGFDWKPVHAPEPTTVISWLKKHPRDDKHLWIIHPDPPLTPHEKKLIRDMCELAGFEKNDARLDIVTPRDFLSRGGVLHPGQDPSIETGERTPHGRRLSISVSPSEDLMRLGLSASHLDYAVAELAQLTFLHGGTLVYGGRVKRDSHDMTTFMAEQAERYATTPDAFENLQPWCEYLATEEEDLRQFEDRIQNVGSLRIVFGDQQLSLAEAARHRNGLSNCDTADCHMSSLQDMRCLAASTTDARVIIGGRLERSSYATVPGTLQEAYLQLEANRPVYICGGFGGVGAVVAEAVGLPTPDGYTAAIPDMTEDAARMLASIEDKWKHIDTGLTKAELIDLAVSHHPSTIAGLILRGMNRLANDASHDLTGASYDVE